MSYDLDFLDSESELRSYFLGMFMADGWLDNNHGVCISLSDEQIINDIATATNYTNKIQHINKRRNIFDKIEATSEESWRLSFSKLYPKMQSLGFPIKKTGFEFIPLNIDNTFGHFLRGLSDGDGCFYLLNGIKRKDGTNKQYFQWELTCVSKEFLEKILELITKHIGPNSIVVNQRQGTKIPVFRLRCNKHNETIKLAELMYNDNSIKLDRKYNIYQNAKNIIVKQIFPWTEEEIDMLYNNIRPPNKSASSISNKRRELGLIDPNNRIIYLSPT